ncbi:MAG TPA: transporter [Steroidobacteraceae bacterium]|nr:transporter [Steroidobacteraceae bacterium]
MQAFVALNLAAILVPLSAMAEPPDASAGQEVPTSQDTAPESTRENDGFDLTRPQSSFEVRGLDQTSSNDTSKTNKAQMLLRVESKIPLDVGWRLGVLAQVPLVQKTTTDFETQSVDHEFGLGDAIFQVVVAHAIDERWAFGVGARVSAQTAADSLGSGEWQLMPGLGVRYSLPEWGADSYFVPSMRYALSIPGNPGARRISEPQIAPTLNIDLPGPFFVTLYPSHDIRINYGAPISGQTGRLFLPFDALVGVRLSHKVQLSLEGSVPIVKAYPVYNFKAEARLRIVF